MDKLLLAEHDYQVDDFIQRRLDSGSRWVALGPSAMARLDDLGAPYCVPEDFIQLETLAAVCTEGQRRVESLCGRLDDELLAGYPDLRRLGMRPFAFNLFGVTIFFDVLRSQIFMLQAVFQALSPSRTFVHVGIEHPCDLLMRFDNADALWGRVARLCGSDAGIEPLQDPAQSAAAKRSRYSSRIVGRARRAILRSITASAFLRSLEAGDSVGMKEALRRHRGESVLLIGGYEWANVLPFLRENDLRIIRTSHASFGDQISGKEGLRPSGALRARVSGNAEMEECFRQGGVDFFDLVEKRFEWIWQRFPVLCRETYRKMRRVRDRYDVRLVLRSSSPTGGDHALNQAARGLGLPVLVWQHGFMSYADRTSELYDLQELSTADSVFVYGRGAEEALRRKRVGVCPKVLVVGSSCLDTLRQRSLASGAGADAVRKERRPRIIVYATTAYSQNGWYLRTPVVLSDRLFFRDQSQIVEAVAGWVSREGLEIEAVVKLDPASRAQVPPWVKRATGVSRLRIVKAQPSFRQLLADADAVILDSPTTTLLETLAARLPVFVLKRHWGFSEELWKSLERRAVCASTVSDLLQHVGNWIESGSYPAVLADDEFFTAFGNCGGDGPVRERVGAHVLACVKHDPTYAASDGKQGL